MDILTLQEQAAELLKPWTRWSKTQSDILTISISRHHLLEAVDTLLKAKWGYLSAITGLHLPGINTTRTEEKQWDRSLDDASQHQAPGSIGDSFIVLYSFCNGPAVLNLRVHPPSLDDISVPSVCGLIPSATLYERELIEMFGIDVTGTPNRDRLILPDDWPDGVYPLRKDFDPLEITQAQKGPSNGN